MVWLLRSWPSERPVRSGTTSRRAAGARPEGGGSPEELARFNTLAGTDFDQSVFQGIYGAEEHEDRVRRVLAVQRVRRVERDTREDWIEVVRRICDLEGDEGDEGTGRSWLR